MEPPTMFAKYNSNWERVRAINSTSVDKKATRGKDVRDIVSAQHATPGGLYELAPSCTGRSYGAKRSIHRMQKQTAESLPSRSRVGAALCWLVRQPGC
eukprot:scaffold246_cov414-Prasinococcus_capsulatus_cf.AAC.5